MDKRRHPTSGFTLIELLMVMAVLVIIVSIVAPRLFSFASGRGSFNEARNLVSMANYARTQSISDGQTYRMNFDGNGVCWLTTPDENGTFNPPANAEFNGKLTPPDGVQLDVTLPSQPDGALYIDFLPSGRCQPATINVRDATRGVITVTCDSPTELFHIVGAS